MLHATSSAARYIEAVSLARSQAEQEFMRRHPQLLALLAAGNEYLASCMLCMSGKDFRQVPHGTYASDLVVSFTRTHFVAIELLGRGELLEAAVLARKQFELLARLQELAIEGEVKSLVGKTPNMRHLKTNLRKLYAAYSALAHSADPVHLQQLGELERDGRSWTPIYPVYSRHSEVTFQHLHLCLAEFHHWAEPHLALVLTDEEYKAFQENFSAFATQYAETYTPSKDGA